MDMNFLRRRMFVGGNGGTDRPWLDYPTLVYNQESLVCSDGTIWTWNSSKYWEIENAVQPTMIKVWSRDITGSTQQLFSNNTPNYECWRAGTDINFRSNNRIIRNLKPNNLYPITFDFVNKTITRSDGSVVYEIPEAWLPFSLKSIAGRAGSSANTDTLYGIQVWL